MASLSLPSIMDIYDVKEMFSRYYVDPELAQMRVHRKWRVKVHENGRAVLLVMVQECKKVVLDYVLNVGSVGMSHVWIELEGPRELVEPLPGTTRSLPTWYWYILPHQVDNVWARTLFGVVGVAAESVERVSLGGGPGRTRNGSVTVRQKPEQSYSWTETSQLYPSPDIVTGSHRFFRRSGRLESEAHVKCFTHFLGDAQVRLCAPPASAVGQLGFGEQLEGFSNPVWVKHCRVSYRVSAI